MAKHAAMMCSHADIMDPLQEQHERWVGDQVIERYNTDYCTSFQFYRRPGEAPDLEYRDGSRLLGVEVATAYYDIEDAKFNWLEARKRPDAPREWCGENFDENLAENINGMRVVAAYTRQEENLAQFNRLQALNTSNNVSAAILNGMEAEFIGRAVGDSAPDAPSGEPGAKSLGVVIAAISLSTGRAAKFRTPDDERLVEQAALLEVLDQAGDGQIDLRR